MNAAGAVAASLVVALLAAVRTVVRRRAARRVARRLSVRRGRGIATPVIAAPARLVSLLDDAAIERPRPDTLFTVAVAGGVALAVLAGITRGVLPGLLLPFLATGAGAAVLVAMRGRGARQYASSLPLALDLVARSLRAGASLHQAVAEAGAATAGPVGADLRAIAQRCALGRSFVAAVDDWAGSRPLPCVRFAAAALHLGAATGGAQARAIDGVAATLRDHVALRDEIRALTSQARISALVIGAAPIVFCTITVVADADSAAFLLQSPAGLAMLTAGLSLDALAAVWMQRLTARVAT